MELRAQVCLILLSVGVLWKLTLTHQYTWMNSPDIVNQVLPWFQFQHVEWRHARFPLWDPLHWGGQSLIGQYQPGVVYPLNWLLFLLPGRNGHIAFGALNWYFCSIHYLAALFTYLLARDLGRSRAASVVSGVAFSFLGYMAATNWPQMLNGTVWSPLVLLFLLRVLRGRAVYVSAALCGAVLGFSQLSGHPQVPTFLALMALGFWSYKLWREPQRANWVGFLLFGCAAAAFSAPQVLPAVEYWSRALRWVGSANPLAFGDNVPYIVHATFSMNPVSVVGLAISRLPGYANPFVGFAVLALSCIAIGLCWETGEVRALCALAASALVYALGGYSMVEGLVYAVLPEVDNARSPAVAICMDQMALAALAAYGIEAIREETARAARVLRCVGVGVAVCAGLILCVLSASFAFQPDKTAYLSNFGMAAVAAGLISAALLAAAYGKLHRRAAALLLSALVVFDAGTVTGAEYPHVEQGWGYLNQLRAFDDIARFLKSRTEVQRVRVDRDAIPFDFGDWYGIEQIDGYCGVTKNIFKVYGDDHARMLLGITDWVGKSPSLPGQEALFTGASGLTVYRNPDAFPRAWVVHRVVRLKSPADIGSVLRQPLPTLRETAYVTAAVPAMDGCGGDQVRIVSRSPRKVVLDASMGCKGMVVVSDSYFPGWKAKVDGARADLYEVDTVIDGIGVGAGRHRVELSYSPGSFLAGQLLFLAGVLLVAAVVWLSPRWEAAGRV